MALLEGRKLENILPYLVSATVIKILSLQREVEFNGFLSESKLFREPQMRASGLAGHSQFSSSTASI